MILGIWLGISHFIFSTQTWSDLAIAFSILFFAMLSYIKILNKFHLLQVIPAGVLLYWGYSYPSPWLPFFMQNYLIVALCLLMFAIIPSHASDHPRPWQRFLETVHKP